MTIRGDDCRAWSYPDKLYVHSKLLLFDWAAVHHTIITIMIMRTADHSLHTFSSNLRCVFAVERSSSMKCESRFDPRRRRVVCNIHVVAIFVYWDRDKRKHRDNNNHKCSKFLIELRFAHRSPPPPLGFTLSVYRYLLSARLFPRCTTNATTNDGHHFTLIEWRRMVHSGKRWQYNNRRREKGSHRYKSSRSESGRREKKKTKATRSGGERHSA